MFCVSSMQVIVKHADHIHMFLYPILFYVWFCQHITCQVFSLANNFCLGSRYVGRAYVERRSIK